MTTETERALNWLGCQNFRPMDKKYLDTIRHALQQNEKLVSALKYQQHTQRKQAELLEARNFRGQVNADTVAHNLKLNAAHAQQALAEYEKGE